MPCWAWLLPAPDGLTRSSAPFSAGSVLRSTGSDTSSNALFGSLQRITSQQLGIDPVLMCAANSAGGVMGKMVDAQSITIATAATDQVEMKASFFVLWCGTRLLSAPSSE